MPCLRGYPASHIAADMRATLESAGKALPSEVRSYDDPLAVLTWTASVYASEIARVEQVLQDGEKLAVETAQQTPHLEDMLDAAASTGRPVVIVSNNSRVAIGKYMMKHGLSAKIAGIIGRPIGKPLKMKPAPHLLDQATKLLGLPINACTMIGDSATDVIAAQRAGARSIGFAKNEQRAQTLKDSGAGVVVHSLTPLIDALLETR